MSFAGYLVTVCLVASSLVPWASPAYAQEATDAESRPAFSLSTSQVFTTRESPHFFLTFRRITQLDVRVYKVRDPFAFFAGLKDPHQLGTWDTPPVPQERSWIERVSDWKRRQRTTLRNIARAQVSPNYRQARRAAQDTSETRQRVQLNVNTFAQVPLLNPDQLVTSWRELLPNHRDTEFRRVPLAVTEAGAYVVEAVQDQLRAYTIVIVSDVGVVTKAAPGQLVMFAANRFTGEPLADCEVRVIARQQFVGEGTTSTDGLFATGLPEDADAVVGVARCGDQIAATDPGAWALRNDARELVSFVYTDKSIYRPGQTVHAKGVLRWREQDAVRPFDKPDVELVVSDDNDKVLLRRTVRVDAFGAVAVSFTIPPTGALGYYRLLLQSSDAQAALSFPVQEYRKPEFEVIVTPASRFVIQGQDAVVTVDARYYFGQPVANGRLTWAVAQRRYWSPLAVDDDGEGVPGDSDGFYGDQTAQGEVRLDANGRAELRIPLPPSDSGVDYTASIQARVTDASSREVSGSTSVNATWGRFLLAARSDRSVYRPGTPAEVQVRAVDYLGTPQPGVAVTLALEKVVYEQGYYNPPTVTAVSSSAAQTDAEGRATGTVTVPADAAHEYRVTVSTTSEGRTVSDHVWLWVLAPTDPTTLDEGDRYLELVADRRNYEPGDVARLIVRGETVTGPVLVTKEGQHVSWYRVLRPTGADAIEVPIEPGDVGDVHVNVTYLREGRLYRAERRLGVPATAQTLSVSVSADQAVSKPQEPGGFTVRVTDHQGQPVRAQVSLAVVDEAVFGVRPDATPDPVRVFYRREYSRVSTSFSREFHFTGVSGRDRLQLAGRRRPFTLADFKGDQPTQAAVRKDFPDAIYWVSDLVTDADGRARVTLKYPDALTTWRLTARAVTEDTRLGATVARTTTTKDLIVRVITPRFLTEGDEVVLPTIVHNYRDQARTASVEVKTAGLTPVVTGRNDASAVSGVALAAGAEHRSDWRFASPTPGTATISATARTQSDTDALELSVPVMPFGLRRDTGVSGSITGAGEASAELTIPATANPVGRSIRVALAPSLAGSMLGALDFLTSYPYGCTEQTLSSFLPNLLVTRAMTELQLAPTERLSALDRQVSAGLRRLYDMQADDGGWGWWKGEAAHPFMTAYALWGLDEARRAGVKVDGYRVENAARALARQYLTYPRALPDLKAYMALALRRSMPERDDIVSYGDGGPLTYRHSTALDELWDARARMSAFGRAVLLQLLDAAQDGRGTDLAAALLAEAETRGDLSWWRVERDDLLFDLQESSTEATAFAVQALVARDPQNAVLQRAVRWLIATRRGGYWGTTKASAMALYGLLGYMQARRESAEPFAVDVFVNGMPAGQRTFAAADLTAADPATIVVPAEAGASQVRLVKRGGGTVYWSASAEYVDPTAAEARSGSRQLAISRRYTVLSPVTTSNPRAGRGEPREHIVYRERAFDGTAAAGDVIAVRVTVAGSPDWQYLAVEDPLPAGVEALQDVSAYPLERADAIGWYWGANVEYRDSRTVFFLSSLGDGRVEFTYLVRVISAGAFRAVPAQVFPMYSAGIYAVSEPQVFTIAPEGSR